ncbi:MAG: hypothetical protein QXI78_04990, partial [Archaeoglobaceae archaeon]
PLSVGRADAERFARWWSLVAVALDRTVGSLGDPTASMVQLWPEHFDVAVDVAAGDPDRRVNLGGSPGDDFHPSPYA